MCVTVAAAISYVFKNTVNHDERVHDMLYQKLTSEYVAKEVDKSDVHPALKHLEEDPKF